MNLPFRSVAASSFAHDVDQLFFVILALTYFFTITIMGTLVYLAVRYRRGSNVDRTNPLHHNSLLEATWSGIPLLMALGIFFWAAKLYANVYAVPANATEIFVIGKQWMWHLQHSNGIRENNELHLPVDEPVKLTMISQDVIHAFYVPEFRLQRQVEPGTYDSFWFTPTQTGKFHLYCNMYCGTQHSEMGGWVYVQSRADYQKWAASGGAKPVAVGGVNAPGGGLTMSQQGGVLFEQYQCSSCHDAEAVSRGRGPNLTGIYGKMRQLADNRQVRADDGYLRNVVYYPNENALAGWPQGMPSFKGVLTEDQVLQINAYIRTLGTRESLGSSGILSATGVHSDNSGEPSTGSGVTYSSGQTESRNGPAQGDANGVTGDTPAADTENQQWRYMYGGEQY